VQGSDIAEGYVIDGLRKKGIKVAIGHKAENLGDAAVCSDLDGKLSATIRKLPPRWKAHSRGPPGRDAGRAHAPQAHGRGRRAPTARRRDIDDRRPARCRRRPIDRDQRRIINSYGLQCAARRQRWMVVEADESDGSFLRLDGTIAVVTNIDPEHLDHYGSFDAVKEAFVEFIENVPFYGCAVLCIDHPEVQAVIPKVRDRRVVTYGFSAQADVRVNMRPDPRPATASMWRCASATARSGGSTASNCRCPAATMCRNALAAVASRWRWAAATRKSAPAFPLWRVKRRFTKVGEVDGVTVIDDYGHHPSKSAPCSPPRAEGVEGRVIAVVQPHRFTRLRDQHGGFPGRLQRRRT